MNDSKENQNKYNLRMSSRFKKHLKLVTKRDPSNPRRIKQVTDILQKGEPLPHIYHDHALTGNWAGHRECHIMPDLLLIYRIIDDILILELVDTGSHSDLFK
ncbi:MAG: type II toxin-antitoxin system YafQ family toxin [Spirochaetaceae bacterium]|nr:type II toxin-antitoxin system YafQ family toxin [Spirochaetaceae bacterium]